MAILHRLWELKPTMNKMKTDTLTVAGMRCKLEVSRQCLVNNLSLCQKELKVSGLTITTSATSTTSPKRLSPILSSASRICIMQGMSRSESANSKCRRTDSENRMSTRSIVKSTDLSIARCRSSSASRQIFSRATRGMSCHFKVTLVSKKDESWWRRSKRQREESSLRVMTTTQASHWSLMNLALAHLCRSQHHNSWLKPRINPAILWTKVQWPRGRPKQKSRGGQTWANPTRSSLQMGIKQATYSSSYRR